VRAPTIDLAGHVVGIPTSQPSIQEFSNTPTAGIGFAIPSNVVVDVAGQRIANGRVTSSPAPIASPTAS
jgi:S1-C subfamily serine protease